MSTVHRARSEGKAWALVHGLAMLMLDGQIVADEALINSIVQPLQ